MPKKPPQPASTPSKLDARALIRPGTQLVCAMADFDAADGYQIRIDEIGEVLRFSHGFCDEDDEDEFDPKAELEGSLAVTAGALADGDELLFLSQGSAHPEEQTDGPYTTCTPPFLVSRRFLAAIKAGESMRLKVHGESAQLKSDGTESVSVKVNGEERHVKALRARDQKGMTVRILDDATWPLLLSAEFQGDNYIHLVAIHALA